MPKPRHRVPSPRNDFVGVGLVSHVPDDGILRGIKNVVERQRQFHRPQAACQMSSRFGDTLNHEAADFIRHHRQRLHGERPQIFRRIDAEKKRILRLHVRRHQ